MYPVRTVAHGPQLLLVKWSLDGQISPNSVQITYSFIFLSQSLQEYLENTAGSILDHHSKVNTAIKQILWFPRAGKSYVSITFVLCVAIALSKLTMKTLAYNSTFKKLRSWHPVPSLHGKLMTKQWKQ